MAKQASAVSAEFEKALGASKTAVKRFKESKKAQPSSGPRYPDIPSGSSVYCRITASADKTKDGTPRVRFRNTVVTGEFKGKSWYKDYYLDNENQDPWDRLSADMQVIAEVSQDEMDEWGDDWLGQMCAVLEEINEKAPCVRVGIVRKTAPAKKGKDGKEMPAREFFNTYYNELMDEDDLDLDDDAADSAEDDGDEDDGKAAPRRRRGKAEEEKPVAASNGRRRKAKEEEAEVEEEEEEVEEDDSDDEEEVAVIEKGMYVWYKPPRKRSDIECKVVTSNKAKQTCSLAEVDGDGKWDAVPWDECEICEEQE